MKQVNFEINPCVICLGGLQNSGVINPKFICPYTLFNCNFYNLSVNEIKDYFELFDAMPEKLKKVLIDKMNNGEFTIKDKDEDF